MRLSFFALSVSALLLGARSASATPICMSVAAFNDEAKTKSIVAHSGTLAMKVTGIDPNAGKGALASFYDLRKVDAMGTPCVDTLLKMFGPGTDLGKVKDEFSNFCCTSCTTCTTERSGMVGCDTWAGAARSSVIFTAPTQTCDIELRFGGTPNRQSYSIKCDDGAGDSGDADNRFGAEVNFVSLLQAHDGWGKMTATVLSDQFCFEPVSTPPTDAGTDAADAAPVSSTTTVAAVEDVTVSSEYPSAVYPDPKDLACESVSEVFLKFVVPDAVGTVKKATLHLTGAGTPSAEGSGGALFLADSNAWHESTLVWTARPGRGARLGRVGPVGATDTVSFDVLPAITGPGTYSFVMATEATDTNGTHFASKEASTTNAPALVIDYEPPVAKPSMDASVAADAAMIADDAGLMLDTGGGAHARDGWDGGPSASPAGCNCTSGARATGDGAALVPLLVLASMCRRSRDRRPASRS